MKIKGHSIIELRDVHTGKKDIYEDDNMITNAVQLFLEDTGMLWESPIKTNFVRNTPIKTLFGGLLLLNDNLTENANNVIAPYGLTMTGNGAAEIVSNGEEGVTELGSWNYTESGWMDDGSYAMVWDFATTQANGTIKCACLTSGNMGYIGIGNAASGSRKQAGRNMYLQDNSESDYRIDPISNSVLNRIVDVNMTNSRITFVDYWNIYYDSTHASEHMTSTGKIKLITKKVPLSKFDIRESYIYNNEGGQNYISQGVTELTMPSAFLTALGNSSPSLHGKFGNYYYILAGNLSLAPSASLQGVRINCTTNVVESFTITNTTDTNFLTSDFGITFGHDTVAICSNHNRVIFQDIFNNSDTDVVSVTISGTAGNYEATGGCEYIREDGCFAGNEGYRIDMINRTVTLTNINMPRGRYGRVLSSDNPFLFNYSAYHGGYWGSDFFSLSHSMDYIATINNLQEEVIKTPEKTMKVTYILRFSD